MYSKDLNVYLKERNERQLETSDGVIYDKREAVLLARETPEDLKAVHKVKKLFDGEAVEPPANPEVWNSETGAVQALWKSRLYGPPAKRKRVSKCKGTIVIQTKLEL
jgi:hypothetical protein